MTFVPAGDYDNSYVFFQPWELEMGRLTSKNVVSIYFPPKSCDEFWLVVHIFIRADGAAEVGLFRPTLG